MPRQAAPPAATPSTAAKPAARARTKVDTQAVRLERERFAAVRASLRRLVVAEENFFAETGSYTSDLERMSFRPGAGTSVRLLWVLRQGWGASVTHSGLPGKDCVVFVGKGHRAPRTQKYRRQAHEGYPACDGLSTPPPPPPDSGATPLAAPVLPDTGSALDALSPTVLMKVDLRNLVPSQETHFATQGSYARRTEPLALQYLWHRDVTIRILSADGESWAAKATHVRFPGRSCVIWFGPVTLRPTTDAQRLQSDRSGVPICDQ